MGLTDVKFKKDKYGKLRPVDGKNGKNPIEIDYAEVERMASIGMYDQDIMPIVGYSSQQGWIQRKYRDSQLVDALKRGRSKGIEAVANSLYTQALEGNTVAQIFYLKTRAGWNDKLIISGDPDNPVRHVISAEPMDIEEWEKKHGRVIEHDENKGKE